MERYGGELERLTKRARLEVQLEKDPTGVAHAADPAAQKQRGNTPAQNARGNTRKQTGSRAKAGAAGRGGTTASGSTGVATAPKATAREVETEALQGYEFVYDVLAYKYTTQQHKKRSLAVKAVQVRTRACVWGAPACEAWTECLEARRCSKRRSRRLLS